MPLPLFTEVASSPEFKSLDTEQKRKLTEKYWDEYSSENPADESSKIARQESLDFLDIGSKVDDSAPVARRALEVNREAISNSLALFDATRSGKFTSNKELADTAAALSLDLAEKHGRVKKTAKLFSPEMQKAMEPGWQALHDYALDEGVFADKPPVKVGPIALTGGAAQSSITSGTTGKYEAKRNEVANLFGMDPEEVDDVVKHQMGLQKDPVSRDAFGQVHIKPDVLAKSPDEIAKAIKDSNLPASIKDEELKDLPKRISDFKTDFVANTIKNSPELASAINLDSSKSGEDNFQTIQQILNKSRGAQIDTGVSIPLTQTLSSVGHVLSLFEEKFHPNDVPALEKWSRLMDTASKEGGQLSQLSYQLNKGQTSLWNTNAAVFGQGAYSVAESVALGAVAPELQFAKLASLGKAGKMLAGALQRTVKISPVAGYYGVQQGLQTYDQAIKAGKTPEEAENLAFIAGSIEGFTTAAFSAIHLGGTENVLNPAARQAVLETARKGIRNAYLSFAGGTTKALLGEQLEENMITALDSVLVQSSLRPGLTVEDRDQAIKDTLKAVLVTTGLPALIEGSHSAGEARQNNLEVNAAKATNQLGDTEVEDLANSLQADAAAKALPTPERKATAQQLTASAEQRAATLEAQDTRTPSEEAELAFLSENKAAPEKLAARFGYDIAESPAETAPVVAQEEAPTGRKTTNRVFRLPPALRVPPASNVLDARDPTLVYRRTGEKQIQDMRESGEVRAKEGKIKGGRTNETHWSQGHEDLGFRAREGEYILVTREKGMDQREGGIPLNDVRVYKAENDTWIDISDQFHAKKESSNKNATTSPIAVVTEGSVPKTPPLAIASEGDATPETSPAATTAAAEPTQTIQTNGIQEDQGQGQRNGQGQEVLNPVEAPPAAEAGGAVVPLSQQPSENLPARSETAVEPRPEKRGPERDAWDETYGIDAKGGRRNNDNGTPYQPTKGEEVQLQVVAATKDNTTAENIDAIGVDNGAELQKAISRLVDDGWTWNAEQNKMVNPANPSESPASGLLRLRNSTKQQQPTTQTNATNQGKQQESNQPEYPNGDQTRKTTEAGSGNRPVSSKKVEETVKEKPASVPLMVTAKMETDLKSRGYDQKAINAMKPQEAWDILNKKPAPASTVPLEWESQRQDKEAFYTAEEIQQAQPDLPPEVSALASILAKSAGRSKDKILIERGAEEPVAPAKAKKVPASKKKAAAPSAVQGELFQNGKKVTKGSITFFADRARRLIKLYKHADPSTLPHEIAHDLRRDLLDRSIPAEDRGGITDADIQAVEDAVGVVDGKWTTANEERFARTVEKYLVDGKAPNKILQPIFDRMAKWMREVYKSIAGSELNIEISDTVREVMDKLFTQNEVTAEEVASALGTTPEALGLRKAMTNEARAAYGMDGTDAKVSQTDQEAIEAAEQRLKNPDAPTGKPLVDYLLRHPEATTSKTQNALLAHEMVKRANAVDQARRAAQRATDKSDRVAAASDLRKAYEALEEVLDVIRLQGSKAGLALQSMKLIVNRQFELVKMLDDAVVWANEKSSVKVSLAPDQREEVQKAHKEIAKLQAELEERTREAEMYQKIGEENIILQKQLDELKGLRVMKAEKTVNAVKERLPVDTARSFLRGLNPFGEREGETLHQEGEVPLPDTHTPRKDLEVPARRGMKNFPAGGLSFNELQAKPAAFKKIVFRLVGHHVFKVADIANKSISEIGDAIMHQMVKNLLSIYDAVPPAIREISRRWYKGANKIAHKWADDFGVPVQAVAGAFAAMSPQKDWFQNVSVVERLLHIWTGRGRETDVFGPEMMDAAVYMDSAQAKKSEGKGYEIVEGEKIIDFAHVAHLKKLMGKSFESLSTQDKAFFVRVYDATYNEPSYALVSPDGKFGKNHENADGTPTRIAWGSVSEISKAIRILEGSSVENISKELGHAHKIRSFYNNIINPDSKTTVTSDTHAVAAAYMLPLSGKSEIVGDNFGNVNTAGFKGTYAFIAEAYRRAAKRRGILPSEMQSVTWEAVREIFPASFKQSKKKVADVRKLWDDFSRGNTKRSYEQTRKRAYESGGGYALPAWNRQSELALGDSGTAFDRGATFAPISSVPVDERIRPRRRSGRGRRNESGGAGSEGGAVQGSLFQVGDAAPTGLDPEVLDNLATVGAEYIVDGNASEAKFTEALVNEFGEGARQHAPEIFAAAKTKLANVRRELKVSATPKEVVTELDPNDELTNVTVFNLARAFLMDGVPIEQVMKKVHAALQEVYPKLTYDEVSDMFTGYGKAKYPSQEEINVLTRELRNIERIKRQIRVVEGGRYPKPTGQQRDAASDRIRELQKELENAFKRAGITLEGDERTLKSPLDALKSRFKNMIADLQHALDTRTKMLDPAKPAAYDEEASQLKAQVDELRARYDEAFADPKADEAKQIERAVASLDRMIAVEEDMLVNGILTTPARPDKKVFDDPRIQQREERLKQLRDARAEAYALANPKKTPEEIALEAAIAQNKKALAREREAVATGVLPSAPTAARKYTPTQELTDILAERETLKKIIAMHRRAAKAAQDTRTPAEKNEARAVAAAEASLAAIEKRIADIVAGKPLPPPKSGPAATLAVLMARAVRNQRRETLKALEAALKTTMTPEERANKRRVDALDKATAKLQDRIKNADFRDPVKIPVAMTAAVQAAKFRNEKAKSEWLAMRQKLALSNAARGVKLLHFIQGFLQLRKIVLLGGDIGAVRRQLGVATDLAFWHPHRLYKMFRAGVRSGLSFSQQDEFELYDGIMHAPEALWYKFMGAKFHSPFDEGYGNKEDLPDPAFLNAIREAPWWKTLYVGRAAAEVLSMAERFQRGFINVGRYEMIKSMVEGEGGADALTPETAALIGNFVMVATGRWEGDRKTKFGNMIEGAIPFLNGSLFISARYSLSRAALAVGQPIATSKGGSFWGNLITGKSPENMKLRSKIAYELYVKSIISRAVVMYLLQMAYFYAKGDDEESRKRTWKGFFDARNRRDFGKIKVGNTRIDVTSGVGPYISELKLLFQMASRSPMKTDPITGRSEKMPESQAWNELIQFQLNRSNLNTAFVVRTTFSDKYFGGVPVTWQNAVKEFVQPIIVKDCLAIYKEHGWEGMAIWAQMMLGDGVQPGGTFPPKKTRGGSTMMRELRRAGARIPVRNQVPRR